MRSYKNALKDYLRVFLKSFRKEMKLSQEEMAEKLKLTPRSYSDLERGVSCLSTISILLLFSLMETDDIINLICDLVNLINEAERDENVA